MVMVSVFAWLLRQTNPLGWGARRLVGGWVALTLAISAWAGGAVSAGGHSTCSGSGASASQLIAPPDGVSLDAYLKLTLAPERR